MGSFSETLIDPGSLPFFTLLSRRRTSLLEGHLVPIPRCPYWRELTLLVYPLSPNIQIQILHTSVHTLPYRIGRENLIKNQSISPLFIILLILPTLSLNNLY